MCYTMYVQLKSFFMASWDGIGAMAARATKRECPFENVRNLTWMGVDDPSGCLRSGLGRPIYIDIWRKKT